MASLTSIDLANRTMSTTKKWVQPDNKRKLKPAREDGSMPQSTVIVDHGPAGRTTRRRRSPLYDVGKED